MLYDYQKEGVKFLMAKKGVRLLADEMGLGKSAQSLAAIEALGLRRVLIICPASVKFNWVNEVKKWTGLAAHGAGLKNQARSNIIITNYERVTNKISTYAKINWDVIILDEGHLTKNPESKRSLAIGNQLAKTTQRLWFLTGTPVPNHAGELWFILRLAGATTFTYNGFLERYCLIKKSDGRYSRTQIVGTKIEMASELKKMIATCSIRRKKQDVLKQLPPIIYQTVEICSRYDPLSDYPELTEGLKEDLAKVEEYLGHTLSVSDDKILEILSVFASSISSLRKYHGLKKAVEGASIIDMELDIRLYDKIVIFCIHKDVVDILRDRLKEYNPAVITGRTCQDDRQAEVHRFNTDKKCRVFIGNISAAGTGINLVAADNLVFIEREWVPSSNAQAAMRIHRIGQDKPCLIRSFCLEGFDAKVTATLIRKEQQISTFIESS